MPILCLIQSNTFQDSDFNNSRMPKLEECSFTKAVHQTSCILLSPLCPLHPSYCICHISFGICIHKALQLKVDYCVQNCGSPLFYLSIYIFFIFHLTVLFIYLALTCVHNILCGTIYIIVSFSLPVFICFVFQLTFFGLMGSITYPVVR